jgi:hypothetical protein
MKAWISEAALSDEAAIHAISASRARLRRDASGLRDEFGYRSMYLLYASVVFAAKVSCQKETSSGSGGDEPWKR